MKQSPSTEITRMERIKGGRHFTDITHTFDVRETIAGDSKQVVFSQFPSYNQLVVVPSDIQDLYESVKLLRRVKKHLIFALTCLIIEMATSNFQGDVGCTGFAISIYLMSLPDFGETPNRY